MEYFSGWYERNPTRFGSAGGRGGMGGRGDEREFVLLTWTMQTGEKVVGYETLGAIVGLERVWGGREGDNTTSTIPTSTGTQAAGTTTSAASQNTQTVGGQEKEEEEEEVEKPIQSQLPWDNIYTRGDLEKSNNTDKGDKKSEAAGRRSFLIWSHQIIRSGYISIGLSLWIWAVVNYVGVLWIGAIVGFVGGIGDWV